jgi:predicted transcriptional regulator
MRRKTTIYLDDDLDRDLERAARARGVSKAEVIRSALRELVKNIDRPVITAIGVGNGPGDVAANVDRHLRETDFGSE